MQEILEIRVSHTLKVNSTQQTLLVHSKQLELVQVSAQGPAGPEGKEGKEGKAGNQGVSGPMGDIASEPLAYYILAKS